MTARLMRHHDRAELVDQLASRLLETLVDLQSRQDTVHLCLAGGSLANEVYARFAELVPESGLEPASLHLWWGDEAFLPTSAPERNALKTLSILARTLRLAGSQTHPMPSSEGHADPDEAAFAYADELGDTVFDVCLLGLNAQGGVASLYPAHESSEPTSSLVVGVTDAPEPPADRMSLTLAAINRSRRVWMWASGAQKTEALARAAAGDESLPAHHARGVESTWWFVDEQAAAAVPMYHCRY